MLKNNPKPDPEPKLNVKSDPAFFRIHMKLVKAQLSSEEGI